MTGVVLAFLPKPLLLPVEALLPSVVLGPKVLTSHKFRQIRASIADVGLIEPLSVTAVGRKSAQHMVLDGHLRLAAMKDLGYVEAACLVSTDDEAFTYNHHISRLSTVQEHLMIRRALDRGIPIARLATALCMNVTLLNKKNALLDGICPEVVQLLKDRTFSPYVSTVLRRMKPTRQVECAELMISANRVTVTYARCLLGGTSPAMLVDGKKPLRHIPLSHEQVARMENEMSNLLVQYKVAEQTHSEDTLNLMLARGYLVKLMENTRAMKYMQTNYAEVLEEFGKIIQATSIDT